jgi:hypothetical protein
MPWHSGLIRGALGLGAFAISVSTGAAGALAAATDAVPVSAEAVLARAFSNRYDVNWISRIELVMRNEAGQEHRRTFHAASKVIGNRVHSVGRLIWPEYLRGMTILTIENLDRSHDAFVYLPSLEKVRRVTTAQRGDSFFGTDVTYEDLERRRVEEFELASPTSGELNGEPVYRIRGRSLRDFSYSEVVFAVAKLDAVILEIHYFKAGQSEPFRVVHSPRTSMVTLDGHVLPTRFEVHDMVRGTWTEVMLTDLTVNPAIDDRFFSVTTLEVGRPLPDPESLRSPRR